MQEEFQIVQPSQNLPSSSAIVQTQAQRPKLTEVTNTYLSKFAKITEQFLKLMAQQLNKENGKKTFQIQKAQQILIDQILRLWKKRPLSSKTLSNIIDLRLIQPRLSIDQVKQKFQPYPSIKVSYNQQILQNNNILKLQNGIFYQGTLNHINISSLQLEYEGQVNEYYQYHGKGKFRSITDKYIYIGDFNNGQYHGVGQLRNSKNVHYVGDFKNDLKSGKGVQIIMKKKKKAQTGQYSLYKESVYDGQFLNGQREGKGIEIKMNKKSNQNNQNYDGEWKNGVKCGEGVMTYENGDKYSGMWKNDLFNGKGTYQENGNAVYVGLFVNGKYQDLNGRMAYKNEDVYQGSFKNGKKNGHGVYNWHDGDYYDGQWKDDFASGKGTTMIGTDFYDGQFLNGKRHGLGELTDQSGDVIKGQWQNNTMVKTISINGESK